MFYRSKGAREPEEVQPVDVDQEAEDADPAVDGTGDEPHGNRGQDGRAVDEEGVEGPILRIVHVDSW